jgi:hypothetical protein
MHLGIYMKKIFLSIVLAISTFSGPSVIFATEDYIRQGQVPVINLSPEQRTQVQQMLVGVGGEGVITVGLLLCVWATGMSYELGRQHGGVGDMDYEIEHWLTCLPILRFGLFWGEILHDAVILQQALGLDIDSDMCRWLGITVPPVVSLEEARSSYVSLSRRLKDWPDFYQKELQIYGMLCRGVDSDPIKDVVPHINAIAAYCKWSLTPLGRLLQCEQELGVWQEWWAWLAAWPGWLALIFFCRKASLMDRVGLQQLANTKAREFLCESGVFHL